MSDLHKILQEEYEKKLTLSPHLLMEMIEEIMSTPAEPHSFTTPEVIEERSASPETMTLTMIPDIAVSEIGWSDVSTDEEGKQIAGPQRQLLENYLSNIRGDDLPQQIASLESFYENGAQELNAATNDRAELIQKVLSYLVFYKTLTKVITNFNASSAGFSFESFLATLMKGKQIPANTGTIADFTTGDNVPISLKLYAEKTLHVEGSFTDLVNDLTKPQFNHPLGNAMRYIVCTKNLSGDGLEQQGEIKFYQFDFTLDNVLEILRDTKPGSRQCVRLPVSFREALAAGDTEYSLERELPSAERLPSAQEMEQVFLANLKALIEKADVPVSQEQFDELVGQLDWSSNDALFKNADPRRFGGTEMGVVRGISLLQPAPVKAYVNNLFPDLPFRGGRQTLATAIGLANATLVKDYSAKKLASERDKMLKAMAQGEGFLSVDDSVALYDSIKNNKDMKIVALENTLGYVSTFQFSLNKTESRSPDAPINTEYLGEINVGAARVENALNLVREILNEQVGAIFNSLKLLTDNLNAYFATGLVDDTKAVDAIDDAGDIQSKTKEIRDQN